MRTHALHGPGPGKSRKNELKGKIMTRRTLLYISGLLALALTTGGFFWYQHYQAVQNAEPIKPRCKVKSDARLAQVQRQLREHRAEVLATRAAYEALRAKRHLLSPEEELRETNQIIKRQDELDRRAKALNDQLMQIQADYVRKLREALEQHGGTQ